MPEVSKRARETEDVIRWTISIKKKKQSDAIKHNSIPVPHGMVGLARRRTMQDVPRAGGSISLAWLGSSMGGRYR